MYIIMTDEIEGLLRIGYTSATCVNLSMNASVSSFFLSTPYNVFVSARQAGGFASLRSIFPFFPPVPVEVERTGLRPVLGSWLFPFLSFRPSRS